MTTLIGWLQAGIQATQDSNKIRVGFQAGK